MRCVVTGHNEAGKSVFLSDRALPPVTLSLLPGFEFHRMWGCDEVPALPVRAEGLPPREYFPSRQGFRFGFFTIPPHTERSVAAVDIGAAFAELREKLPGMAEVLEFDHPGMHTTDTVDYDVVLSGEAWLELDDGAEVHLRAGDCVVQNGTRHAWHNRSGENCVIAVCLVGARRGERSDAA
ncbi:MAG: cupin domain-containing protein [Bryobacterales bacterium]|nr:cupin domain-containing protein [Bryobacterales bacterium]